ncbi:DMT family transporter [Labrys wisconsinensis]|uniref:Drug/metabolite transporter (DMT)-like permease n=1 Tax=Labrys wisconsinensis TaxID=425677 RepID=A0ABU0JDU4_9HYPH|nr:DMT family transporter [Labrys wisconsinensis]MDQ0472451.1 drug/metabolite transporter (DMT)-like permease [Labrys wisconsinensis]
MTAAIDPSATATARAEHRLGVIFVLASAVTWSLSGVFARLLGPDIDVWTAVFLRSGIGAAYMAIGTLVVHRGRSLAAFRAMGGIGLLVVLTGAISMVAFIGAFFHTSVANVSVIYSTTPFIAAGLGWVMLREAVSARTLIAAVIALAGVTIMVSGSFAAGHLLGDGLALVMAGSFAVMAVLVKVRRELDMLPVNFLVCLFSLAFASPFADPARATAMDLIVLAAFAFCSIALAFFLFLAGARRIPAAEAGLITTLEVVLSPLWVFLLFAENPGRPAIIGGAVVFAAVVWHIVGDRRRA